MTNGSTPFGTNLLDYKFLWTLSFYLSQVILKPDPGNSQDLFIRSLSALGSQQASFSLNHANKPRIHVYAFVQTHICKKFVNCESVQVMESGLVYLSIFAYALVYLTINFNLQFSR